MCNQKYANWKFHISFVTRCKKPTNISEANNWRISTRLLLRLSVFSNFVKRLFHFQRRSPRNTPRNFSELWMNVFSPNGIPLVNCAHRTLPTFRSTEIRYSSRFSPVNGENAAFRGHETFLRTRTEGSWNVELHGAREKEEFSGAENTFVCSAEGNCSRRTFLDASPTGSNTRKRTFFQPGTVYPSLICGSIKCETPQVSPLYVS